MKYTFYGTFVSGMQSVVEEIVKTRLEDGIVKKLLDGGIIFETECSYDRLNFFCFNNLFSVLDILEDPGGEKGIEAHIRKICGQKNTVFPPPANKNIRTFRIISSYANRLVPVNENLRREAESFISRRTGLSCDRSNPGTEYWFLYRHEGFSVFMERRSRHRSLDKVLHRGELPPQLAYMMCRLSAPAGDEVVLDPFCGYGSIMEQRLKHFPPEKFYAFDIKDGVLKIAGNKIKGNLSNYCTIKKLDIRNIFSVLPEGSVDKIITDPPWGMFEGPDIPLRQFYGEMVKTFRRLLKTGGRIVLLTAAEDELRAVLADSGGLTITGTLHILVSGKKAGLFVLKKTGPVLKPDPI